MNPENEWVEKSQTQKKVYSRPTIEAYGGLAEITRSVGKSGIPDGGNSVNGKNFTH